MTNITSPGNHNSSVLNYCNDKSPLQSTPIDDKLQKCDDNEDSLKQPRSVINSRLEHCETGRKSGVHNDCDEQMSDHIKNDPNKQSSNIVYKYSRIFESCDEAMLDMFSDIVVIDEDGKAFPIPILYAEPERAVAYILQENIRKDNSNVIDRIMLPILTLYGSNPQFDQERYTYHKALDYFRVNGKPGFVTNETGRNNSYGDTIYATSRGIPLNITYNLNAITLYKVDMNQILEQIIGKFSSIAYLKIRGVHWETICTLDSMADNIDRSPGEGERVIKYQFGLTLKTYMPQPLVRKKPVLRINVDTYNTVDENEIIEVIQREDTDIN
jgi:hypothetical protein